MTLTIDQVYLTQLLQQYVQIDSRNPALEDGGAGEGTLGRLVAQQLTDLGLEVHLHELAPERVNVVGVLRGAGNGRSLMLNAHMDTVGVAGMEEPFSGAVQNGRLFGRGSQDMKGSLAAQVAAVKAILDAGITLNGSLLLTGVADEEFTSIGTDDIVTRYTADAAIVTEPTDLNLGRAHRGFAWFEVTVLGRAAHGSRYEEGIDANMRMGRFLAELDKLEQSLRQREPHPLTAVPSLHAAQLQGGTAPSIYADRCTLTIERRLNPGETAEQAQAEIQAILDILTVQDSTFEASLRLKFVRSPFEVAKEASIVQTLAKVMEAQLGQPPIHVGASFWTDAAILADAGIDTVLLGPIGQGLHSAEEWVDLQSVIDLAAILADTICEFCGIIEKRNVQPSGKINRLTQEN